MTGRPIFAAPKVMASDERHDSLSRENVPSHARTHTPRTHLSIRWRERFEQGKVLQPVKLTFTGSPRGRGLGIAFLSTRSVSRLSRYSISLWPRRVLLDCYIVASVGSRVSAGNGSSRLDPIDCNLAVGTTLSKTLFRRN